MTTEGPVPPRGSPHSSFAPGQPCVMAKQASGVDMLWGGALREAQSQEQ